MSGLFLFLPLLVIAVSVPLILGKVPRNHWYGFRTPKTLSSDSVWYPANRIGGKYLCTAALIELVAFAVGFAFWPAQMRHLGGVITTVPMLLAIVFWFVAIRHI
jgi:uncharacterized membrane protein